MRSLVIFIISTTILFSCKKKDEEKTVEYGSVIDVNGHVYKTVKIGDQWWMAENLKATTFNDSSLIISCVSTSDSSWVKTKSPMYYFTNLQNGNLYNGYVITASKNIAPKGWHIATDEDWKKLESNLKMSDAEIQKYGWRGTEEAEDLAASNDAGWPANAILFGSNKSGFNAFPSGCYVSNGYLNQESNAAFWWTSTPADSGFIYRNIDFAHKSIFRYHVNKNYGLSIRCVKD